MSDELDDTEDGVSEDGDDDAWAESTDSLGQHVKSSDEAIPGDTFEVFKFGCPGFGIITNLVY